MPASTYWTALIRWYWDTGERSGATWATQWRHVDLGTGVVILPRRRAEYVLRGRALASLRRLRADTNGSDWVWRNCCYQTWQRRFGQLLVAAGLPATGRDKAQRIRRSFGSHLEARGGDATKALGHANRHVTRQSYLDPTIAGIERHNERLFEI